MAAKKDPRRPLSSMSITIMSSRNTGLLACYAVACTISLLMDSTTAFVAPSSGLPSASRRRFDNFAPSSSRLDMMMMDATNAFQDAAMALSSSSSTMLLAETEPWVQPLALVLDPALNLLSFAMLCRVVLSWYPTTNLNELPWNLVSWPTEPLLRAIRNTIPPAFGVDITPIVWLGIFTFFHEILLGQQGLLTMKIKYGM